MKATKTASAFRMECAITVNVQSTPEKLWSLLVNAQDMPRWNSTITSIEGTIATGNKLALRVPLAPNRVFKPRVTKLEPRERE